MSRRYKKHYSLTPLPGTWGRVSFTSMKMLREKNRSAPRGTHSTLDPLEQKMLETSEENPREE
jgi:hypothetical protein